MQFILYFTRKNIFNESITKINEYNKNYNDGNISHISGINKFSDWVNNFKCKLICILLKIE